MFLRTIFSAFLLTLTLISTNALSSAEDHSQSDESDSLTIEIENSDFVSIEMVGRSRVYHLVFNSEDSIDVYLEDGDGNKTLVMKIRHSFVDLLKHIETLTLRDLDNQDLVTFTYGSDNSISDKFSGYAFGERPRPHFWSSKISGRVYNFGTLSYFYQDYSLNLYLNNKNPILATRDQRGQLRDVSGTPLSEHEVEMCFSGRHNKDTCRSRVLIYDDNALTGDAPYIILLLAAKQLRKLKTTAEVSFKDSVDGVLGFKKFDHDDDFGGGASLGIISP